MKKIIAFIVYSYLLTACQTTLSSEQLAPPPVAAAEGAINSLEQYLIREQESFDLISYDLSEIQVYRSFSLTSNRADELNGIEEKWCLGLRYIAYHIQSNDYFELGSVYLVSEKAGDWIVREIFDSKEHGSAAESQEGSWNLCLLE